MKTRLRPRAHEDERPTVAEARVRLAGDVTDGPEGTVIRVADDGRRVVLFDGDRHATWCELSELRRLP